MKKNLITVALLAASGIASAQSSVTLYGIADVWFGSFKTDGVRQTKIDSGGVDQSRFGFKGSEDLGGGLKANFVLEQGFLLDSGAQATAGQMFSRQSFVGLSGGFGEARIGKTWTPFDDIDGVARPAFNSALSPSAAVWASTGYNANPANTVYYATPSFSGFSGAASYSLGENKTASVNAGKIMSVNVKYEGGPIYAGLAYQLEKADGNTDSARFARANASYDLGVVKLLAGYGYVGDKAASGLVKGAKTNEYELGLDFPVSSVVTVSGGYAYSKTKDAGADDSKSKGYSLAATYSLSKRTYLYGGVHTAKTTQAGTPDAKTELVAVGVHHAF